MARVYPGFSHTEIRRLTLAEMSFYLEPAPEPEEDQDQ